ncbi:hypothetical protein PX699_23220 [Sphingobium sp. H39-3-25]|uniref:hypothetical protein n=1 Tax=Sphingobium arseniciresistens TaxID=3030834 RepID=UPI0023B8FA15|nr:hypothetical protein [Sphingobium arseniciresistens]
MIDRASIEAAWATIAHLLDPVHQDAEADALLRNPEAESPGIEAAIVHMGLVDRTMGGAIQALGYDFAADPLLWTRANEATLQARCLQQLSSWWKVNPQDAALLQDVVVRTSFGTSYGFATPQHIIVAPVHFVIVPYVYQELLMLSARAFDEALGRGEDKAWSALANSDTGIAPSMPPAMRRLFARLLTDHAFHPAEPGDNPTDALMARSEILCPDGNSYEPYTLESHLSYSALDYALSHELAHRVLHAINPDFAIDQALEQAADLIGFRFFACSWGWRDDIFEGAPLSEGGRILLGPLWFFYSASMFFTLRSLLAARVAEFAPGSALARRLAFKGEPLLALTERWHRVKGLLAQYAEVAAVFGAPLSKLDGIILDHLTIALSGFTDALQGWVEAIPEADILFAAELPEI